jgi:Quinohemoprotein amine dehydrogenase, alpha subunit domain III
MSPVRQGGDNVFARVGITGLSVLMAAAPATGFVSRASVASDGAQANGPVVTLPLLGTAVNALSTNHQWLSSTGRYVTFTSSASNLVSGDTNGVADVFRHDNVTGTTVRVSLASDGSQMPSPALVTVGSISGNGQLIAFTTNAALVPQDTNATWDVYVRDVGAGTTTLASILPDGSRVGPDSTLIGFGARGGSFSTDGAQIAFVVGGGGSNPVSSIYVRDLTAPTTALVASGFNTSDVTLSGNGEHILVREECFGLGPCSGPLTRVVDLAGPAYGAEALGSHAIAHYLAISRTGRYVLEVISHNSGGPAGPPADGLYRYDRATAGRTLITNRAVRGATMSGDGRIAAFTATSAVARDDTNRAADVYSQDIDAGATFGATERISVSADGEEGNGTSALPMLSANGNVAAYVSKATNLVPNDTNGVNDLFVTVSGHPVITGLTPTEGMAGQQHLQVRVHGSFLNPGATVDFGRSITVESVARAMGGGLNVKVTVAVDATGGRRQVTVTNPGPLPRTRGVCQKCFAITH